MNLNLSVMERSATELMRSVLHRGIVSVGLIRVEKGCVLRKLTHEDKSPTYIRTVEAS